MAQHGDNSALWWLLGGATALFAFSRRTQIVDAIEARIYAPRLASYLPIFREVSQSTGIPVSLLAAIGHKESSFRADAVNYTAGDAARGGAWGLMQMTWATAVPLMKRLGHVFDPPDLSLIDPNKRSTYLGPLVGLLDPYINVALSAANLLDAARICGSAPREAGCYYNGGKCCTAVRDERARTYGDRLAELQARYSYLDLDIGLA